MSYTKKDEDMLRGETPSEDIICKDCTYRNDGTIWSSHHTKISCQQFPYPQTKPKGVLFQHADCPEYKKE